MALGFVLDDFLRDERPDPGHSPPIFHFLWTIVYTEPGYIIIGGRWASGARAGQKSHGFGLVWPRAAFRLRCSTPTLKAVESKFGRGCTYAQQQQ